MFCQPLRLAIVVLIAGAAPAFAAPLDGEPIKPLPANLNPDPSRAALGRRLFHEPRLSANGAVSCASCHALDKGGADGRDRSIGFDGRQTAVNAPTVFNAALNFRQFWNGRAATLEAQVDAVVQHPVEMGSKWEDVVAKLARDPNYRSEFARSYPDGVTKANIQDAIASFERTLITPDSRFDRYLRGDGDALSAEEKAGYTKFKQYGCVTCHQGVNVGGNMFQKFGVMADYFAKRGHMTEADLGRYVITGDVEDTHVFKVPSLRNVALTAPYFHDGSAKTLGDAVDVMFRYQLGRPALQADKVAIVKFLETLTGDVAGRPR
ncbi:cytochrome-c peroxidase [Azoarcus sp. KH32C]|uniref:cytochrome-c peroxidase n=1 Tax=Azoarcus sp. KH32C TaxID=748247 RepID=UPI00023869BC|nr:cytochrome-c peroxidase [Azoarcus sp. KH32C]BAL26468.1 cytochrome c peroxidase [Azoarcus sp. KH32C]